MPRAQTCVNQLVTPSRARTTEASSFAVSSHSLSTLLTLLGSRHKPQQGERLKLRRARSSQLGNIVRSLEIPIATLHSVVKSSPLILPGKHGIHDVDDPPGFGRSRRGRKPHLAKNGTCTFTMCPVVWIMQSLPHNLKRPPSPYIRHCLLGFYIGPVLK